MAQAAMTRKDWGVGLAIAVAVHVGLGVSLALSPPPPRQDAEDGADKQGCASVVSPACVGAAPQQSGAAPAEEDEDLVAEDRRCPEPLRRRLRAEPEAAPAVAVDLLQAQVVAALGVETGKPRQEIGTRAGQSGEAGKPQTKLADMLAGDTKLGSLLKDDDGGQAKKRKLGNILGTATGQKDGDGKVNLPGSAYVRQVRLAVQQRFVLPPSIPVWEKASLAAKVRITRMTATGQVLAFAVEKKSGNPEFDQTVHTLMLGYKSGLRSLPAPPPHILEEVNSRGMVVELRGGQ